MRGSRAETRETHPLWRFANVGERSRELRIDAKASKREGGKVAIDILVMPEARSEKRRSGGEGEFSPLPRRRKAWFVPLLCLCLPFLTRILVPSTAVSSCAYVCMYTHVCVRLYTQGCTLKRQTLQTLSYVSRHNTASSHKRYVLKNIFLFKRKKLLNSFKGI